MPVPNIVGLSDSLKKFYTENLASGVNDLLDASQGFPPFAIEAKGVKLASELPEMAGLVSLAAAKNIPRIKQLLIKKFGFNPTQAVLSRYGGIKSEIDKGPKLKYFLAGPRSQKEWNFLSNRGRMTTLNLNSGESANPNLLLNSQLNEVIDAPHNTFITSLLGKNFPEEFLTNDIPYESRLYTQGIDDSKKAREIATNLFMSGVPKKYKNIITKYNQLGKDYKFRTAKTQALKELLLQEIMDQSGLTGTLFSTRWGEPSQGIINMKEFQK